MSWLQKNTEGQKWLVYAWNATNNTAVTGDAANITAKLSKDYGTLTALGDTNPTELETGFYLFDLTQAETDADDLYLVPVSGTVNVNVIAMPHRMNTDELLAVKIAGLAVSAQRSGLESPGALRSSRGIR